MVVITLSECPISLRGDLTKWLLEINTGVFVGKISARVRDNLWERIRESIRNGKATMVYNARNEQGLEFKVHNSIWEPIDFDGIKLLLRPSPARIKELSGLRLGYSKASKNRLAKRMRKR
jgi:CRISPR-associated protein Cas2